MATTLINVVQFTGLVVGVPTALPHGLNLNGTGLLPDLVFAGSAGYGVTVTTSTVTVTRPVTGAATVNVLVWSLHSMTRVLPNGVVSFPGGVFDVQSAQGAAAGGGWVDIGTIVSLNTASDTVAVGAGAMFGTEKMRVVGDLRVEGKATITGSLDPTDIILSGGTAQFMQYGAGSTAAVSPASQGRIRYNESTNQFQISENGGAYTDLTSALTGFTTANNTGLGISAGDSITAGVGNTLLGVDAGTAITTQNRNTAVGNRALVTLTSGDENVAIGFEAMDNTVGIANLNVAVGYQSLGSTGTGLTTTGCVAVGAQALQALSTGLNNVGLGAIAGSGLTTGDDNLCIGFGSGGNKTTTNRMVAVGSSALSAGVGGANDTVAIGHNALLNNTADFVIAIGSTALDANTTGARNIAIGYGALGVNTTASDSIAIGHQALVSSTGSQNTVIGSEATSAGPMTATNTTAVGYRAGRLIIAANNITAIGSLALSATLPGADSTAVGYQALLNSSAVGVTAVGSGALAANTTGVNTAVGFSALSSTMTGGGNTALGYQALLAMTGSDSTAIGANAMLACTSGNGVAVGSAALAALTTGGAHVAVGFSALAAITTASGCTAVGNNSLVVATGGANTAVGASSGVAVSTGTNNSLLGASAGSVITTGVNNTMLGQNANVDVGTAARRISIGVGATATVDDGLFFPTSLASVATGSMLTFTAGTGQLGPATTSVNFTSVATTTDALAITASSLTTGSIASFYSNSADASARNLVVIRNDNAAATSATALSVVQDAPITAAFIGQNANGIALNIDHLGTTQTALDVSSDTLTTGQLAAFYSNSADTGTRNLVSIHQDHASGTGTTGLRIQQDSTGPSLSIASSGNGISSTTETRFFDRSIRFRQNVGDETNAGTISYRYTPGNSLDLVGAGTTIGGRLVSLYDGMQLLEVASVPGGAPAAGFGATWVRNDAPNTLMFTNDAGTNNIVSPVFGYSQATTGTYAAAVFPGTTVTGTGITLPVAGTYRVGYVGRAAKGAVAGTYVSFLIWDVTVGASAGGEALAVYSLTAADSQGSAHNEIHVTVAAGRQYELRVFTNAPAVGVDALSNGEGRCALWYARI